MDLTGRHETTTFFVQIQQEKQIQQVNRLLTLKTEQEWSSGKHLLPFPRPGRGLPVLPTMAFMERLRLKGVPFSCFWYMKWYEFVVGFLPLREVFLWVLRFFPLNQKPTFPKSNSTQNRRTRISFQQLLSAPWENKLQITSLFVYFFRLIPWLRQN